MTPKTKRRAVEAMMNLYYGDDLSDVEPMLDAALAVIGASGRMITSDESMVDRVARALMEELRCFSEDNNPSEVIVDDAFDMRKVARKVLAALRTGYPVEL